MSTPLVRLWFATDTTLRRVRPSRWQGPARAVVAGVFMGAGSERWRDEVDEEAYSRRRYSYHDTDEHNLRGLFAWEREALSAAFPPSGRILVTSAGGGREIIALARLGYDVVGTECHAGLRRRAEGLVARLGIRSAVLPAPRDHVGAVDGPFDAAVIGWGAYAYVRGARRRRAFLEELRAELVPRAPILLSFHTREGDRRRFRWLTAIGNTVARLADHEPVEIGDVLDPTWQHYFTRDELRAELASAGFELVSWSRREYGHAVARRTS